MASREFELGGGVKIGFSPLLVCMMLGTVFCNFSEYSVDIMDRSSKWTAPLYALFFVLSGAELDLGVFRYPATILIGVVYSYEVHRQIYRRAAWQLPYELQ